MAIQVLLRVGPTSVNTIVSTLGQVPHRTQFNGLVQKIINDLQQSGYNNISVETYHELLTWGLPKSGKSSYKGAKKEAEQWFYHLFDYQPPKIIGGRDIRDINPGDSADAQLLESYHNSCITPLQGTQAPGGPGNPGTPGNSGTP
jgi:hypothetical protein